MTFDPLKLSSGLLDDDDVTFSDAIFRTDAEFRDGQVLFLDATLLTSDGDETNKYFGTGNGWETDDGTTANREDGRDINFNKKSAIGEAFGGLVACMKDDPKADKAVRERLKDHPLGPRDAGFWKGLKCHVTAVDRKGGGEVDDYQALIIDKFYGWDGAAGGAKKAATPAKKAAKKAAAKPKAEAAADEGGVSDEIRERLIAIGLEADSHEEFMEAAFTDVPEASSDAAVKAAVSDGGEGSIWAEAVALYESQNG